MDELSELELKARAIMAISAYYASLIRQDEDPDHSGPEDAADALARRVVAYGEDILGRGDWRDLLE